MARQNRAWRAFTKSVARWWWLLVAGGLGGVQTVLSLAGLTPAGSWAIGAGVAIGCLVIAMYLAYRDLYISTSIQWKIEKPPNLRRRTLTYRERLQIDRLNGQMGGIHGHDDRDGIELDAIEGWDWDDILQRKCSRCSKPRNEEGGYVTD